MGLGDGTDPFSMGVQEVLLRNRELTSRDFGRRALSETAVWPPSVFFNIFVFDRKNDRMVWLAEMDE